MPAVFCSGALPVLSSLRSSSATEDGRSNTAEGDDRLVGRGDTRVCSDPAVLKKVGSSAAWRAEV